MLKLRLQNYETLFCRGKVAESLHANLQFPHKLERITQFVFQIFNHKPLNPNLCLHCFKLMFLQKDVSLTMSSEKENRENERDH